MGTPREISGAAGRSRWTGECAGSSGRTILPRSLSSYAKAVGRLALGSGRSAGMEGDLRRQVLQGTEAGRLDGSGGVWREANPTLRHPRPCAEDPCHGCRWMRCGCSAQGRAGRRVGLTSPIPLSVFYCQPMQAVLLRKARQTRTVPSVRCRRRCRSWRGRWRRERRRGPTDCTVS